MEIEDTPINDIEPTEPQVSVWDGYGAEISEEYKPLTEKYSGGINDVLKALKNSQDVISRKALVAPDENATPEAIEAWHKHIGRPDSVDDYEYEVAEDIKPIVDEGYMGEAKKLAHDLGLTQKQFQKLVDFRFDEYRRSQELLRDMAVQNCENSRIVLEKEWGEDKDAFVEEIHSTLKESEVYEEFSRVGLLNSANAMKFLHSLVGGMREGSVPSKNQMSTIEGQLKALYNSDAYNNLGHPDHVATMKRIGQLNEMKVRGRR